MSRLIAGCRSSPTGALLRRIEWPARGDRTPSAPRDHIARSDDFPAGLGDCVWSIGSRTDAQPVPIQKAIDALQLVGFGPPDPAAPHSPDEWLRRLGTLPLMAQPGEALAVQHRAPSVLGVLIARASGQPAQEEFMRERIFEPLGYAGHRNFSVPPEKLKPAGGELLAQCANARTGTVR